MRHEDLVEQEYDEEDLAIFNLDPSQQSQSQSKGKERAHQADDDDDYEMDIDDEDDYKVAPKAVPTHLSKAKGPPVRPADDWKHDPAYVQQAVENLMLPPFESSGGATMALQKELRAMQREQDNAKSLKELGWYMPPEFMGDNLYQWIVEMHSFDPEIPIAKDMKKM